MPVLVVYADTVSVGGDGGVSGSGRGRDGTRLSYMYKLFIVMVQS